MSIAAWLYVLLGDCEWRRLFLDQKDHRAQSLLNLMQELLDDASLDLGKFRSPLTTALVRLSRNSVLYPERLLLRDVSIKCLLPVASGGYGDVYQGDSGGRAVAVKMMQVYGCSTDERIMKAFAKEAVLWAQLSSPHILPFYGVHTIKDRLCLISPWMKNGTLTQYLNKTPRKKIDRISLVSDIAFGLDYLHSFDPQIIHGDLKGANILITDHHRACVADFGLCLLAWNPTPQITMTASSNNHGTSLGISPELFNDDEECVYRNCATDVYAFGCVQIFNGQPPFFDPHLNKARIDIKESRIPPRPAHRDLDDTLWMLILQCLHKDPLSRPSTSEVAQQLSSRYNLDFCFVSTVLNVYSSQHMD
ncbi:kinase-like domain-containing protein [Hygrophoropsis aurantiaca]|uniref:Kinase-like domain-containing protein n=1 Tax=Hygrophoropsis aurantiaca TaxID=72124 RepID=A0ACB7ZS27_9AGAM|nr:kinase-like domain-containing protein [Hygrophoropsis aurantiaca]